LYVGMITLTDNRFGEESSILCLKLI
jgi:hypothetical protein